MIEYAAMIITGISLAFSSGGLKIAFTIVGGVLTSLSLIIN